MRRESSTVVVLIGDADDGLLAGLARSPNVSVARVPASDAVKRTATRRGWEPGALAMRAAARRRSTYVIVPDDPLAHVASGWRAMWDVSSASAGPDAFERPAAEALAAWRDKRFELPDYYLVTDALEAERTDATAPDMYLGPLRALRPSRVAVAGAGGFRGVAHPGQHSGGLRGVAHPGQHGGGLRGVAHPGQHGGAPDFADSSVRATRIVEALRSLEHGPWWPPLDELLAATRDFYAGGLAAAR